MPNTSKISSGQTIQASDLEPDIRVAFVLSPQFTLLPFAGFIDAMRHSADEEDRSRQIFCRWECVSATLDPVTASCGIEVLPWRIFENPEQYDYVVVVGGLLSAFDHHFQQTFEFLREAYHSDVSIIGLCTGSFVIAEAGLMSGRRCAVHIHHRQQLLERYPDIVPVVNEMYVQDERLITCPGGTAAIDLAVEILSRHCGRTRGMKGMTALVVDEHRGAHHVGRMPFQDLEECGEWRVEAAVRLMRQNLGNPGSINELAKMVGSTVRQMDRSFKRFAGKPPQMVWREMRLEQARWRLMNSNRSITQIAHECGFSDSSHFSRWFRRLFNESPQSYRKTRRTIIRRG
ncbi:MAG: GlxA family transcriptional regulator [Pseudomonadota bacterium]